jgi:HlyD family secretion protein
MRLKDPTRFDVTRHTVAGLLAMALLVGGVGTLAGATLMSGAVIAHGALAVTSNVKQVQHLEGGIVRSILVKEGDRVTAGDVLVSLDPVLAEAGLAILKGDMDQQTVRLARLEAERDSRATLVFPRDLEARSSEDAQVVDMMAAERTLFAARHTVRVGKIAQLRERAEQLRQEIGGLSAQLDGKSREIALIEEELVGTRQLWSRQLIPIARVTAIEREAARLGGERGSLLASMARARAAIAETELQILQVDQDLKGEVSGEIREAQAALSNLAEKRLAAEETLRRLDIRAPQSGIVHELAVQTVGGVVASGGVLMHIVPQQEGFRIDARVAPDSVDQLYPGQEAVVHFSAFDRSTTPELRATVGHVSPNLTSDPKNGTSYYLIRLDLAEAEIARLGNLRLIPGMPVECFIRTQERTMLSYVTKPLMDQMNRSFRD